MNCRKTDLESFNLEESYFCNENVFTNLTLDLQGMTRVRLWRFLLKITPRAPNGCIEPAAISTETAPSVSFVHCRSIVICCTLQHFTIRLPFLNGDQLLYEPMHFKAVMNEHRAISFQLLPDLRSKITGSKSTALFCLLQLSPEPAVESVCDFSLS